jgi:hypothetical protein
MALDFGASRGRRDSKPIAIGTNFPREHLELWWAVFVFSAEDFTNPIQH